MPPIPQCSECCRTANEVGALWPTAWGTLLCEVCHRKRDPDPPREKKAENSPPLCLTPSLYHVILCTESEPRRSVPSPPAQPLDRRDHAE